MTLKRILLWIAAAGLLATACSEKEQQPEDETKPLVEPVMTLLSGEIPIFSDQGGETTVSFSSTCPWKVTSSAKWVVITPSSGEAGEELEVTVKVLASNIYEQRHSTLTFSCSNGKEDDSATLEILQKQQGAIIVSPNSIPVKAAGETITINLKGSSEISFEILGEAAKEWIIPVEVVKDYFENAVQFEIKPNESVEPREGVISFSNESGSEDVTIIQAAKATLIVETTSFPVDYEETEITIPVKSNFEVSYSISDEGANWIIPVEDGSKALIQTDYKFTITENIVESERSATITFISADLSEVVTITQAAAPAPDPNVIKISSAEGLISFVERYNAKEFDVLTDPLDVSLVNDITFDATTSEAFNATGGIGIVSEGYYFDALFDGKGYSIDGLSATYPLFAALGANATVKNLTIGSSCTFTFANPDSDETCLGAFAKEVSGTIDNCTFAGTIAVPSTFSVTAKKVYIGGIAGKVNAGGKIQASTFSGLLSNEGKLVATSETSDLKASPFLNIGGIAGLNSGTVSNCNTILHATGIAVASFSGSIVTHSVNAYHYAIAGIVGRNEATVEDCTNNASVLNFFSGERGKSGNMNGRYAVAGGIVGYNSANATVSTSINSGAIIDRANPKVQYVGGVVARNFGTVTSCSNSGTVEVDTPGTSGALGARMLYCGGVVGANDGSVSNISNAGNVTVGFIESTGGIFSRTGGVIGNSSKAIDGAADGGEISNTGEVSQTHEGVLCSTPTATNDYGLSIGGIIGWTSAGVANVSNKGKVSYNCTAKGVGAQYVQLGGVVGKVNAEAAVEVKCCSNYADVLFTASASHKDNAATRYYYNYLGGIAGYARNAAIAGDASSKCTNSGAIKGGDGSDDNNQATPSFAVGGIVGYITGESSIDYCALVGSGNAFNDHWSNREIDTYDCPTVGGIAGQIVGTDSTPIPVSNCEVESTATLNARRGAIGGIAGLAQWAEISNCVVPIDIYDTQQSGYYYGGIVAGAKDSNINSCQYTGAKFQSSEIVSGGGIVARLDSGTTVDDCSSSVSSILKGTDAITSYGGIAGMSVAGSTIKNCHYRSTIQICSDTEFTDDGSNAADITDE